MTGALLRAVSAGRSRQVKLLLDNNVDLEQRDECNQTALIRAVFVENGRQRERVLKLLLRRGARVSSSDVAGRNALHWACIYGHDRDVGLMLEFADGELDLNRGDMNGQSALFHAAVSSSAATVKRMVDALRKVGLTLDTPSYSGVTPLMQATKLGHDICVSILLRGGATVGATAAKATAGYDLEERTQLLEECFETAERWATKSNRVINRSSSRNTRQSSSRDGRKSGSGSQNSHHRPSRRPRFPPILPQAVAQKIKYRENRAAQLCVHVPIDSDDDSVYGSEVSYYTDQSFDTLNNNSTKKNSLSCSSVVDSPRALETERLSVMSVSQTSSTENNISSDDEADVSGMAPVHKPGERVFQSTQDLHALYQIYQELKSPSYRQGVAVTRGASVVDCPSSSSDSGTECLTPKSDKKARKTKKSMEQISELRKMLLRKQTRQAELAYLSIPQVALTKFQRPPATPTPLETRPESVLESDTDGEGHVFNRKVAVLPRITKKTAREASNINNENEQKNGSSSES